VIPRVSVIIPTHNRAQQTQCAIDSVLAQTFSDLEVIVVDDGSSDGTANVLREAYGDRIRYFYQANQGPSMARNRGIEAARGEWIAFLDSDDLWEKDKLDWQFKALEKYGWQCAACYTDVQLFNSTETRSIFQLSKETYLHGDPMGVNTEVWKLLVDPAGGNMVLSPSSLLARAEVVRKTGGFDPRLRYTEDTEFLFRLSLVTGFCYVNRPLVRRDQAPPEVRHVGISADWNRVEFRLQHSQLRWESLLRLSESLPKKMRSAIREGLRSTHSAWANWYLVTGQFEMARQAVSRAAMTRLTINGALKWLLTWVSPQLALRHLQHRIASGKTTLTLE